MSFTYRTKTPKNKNMKFTSEYQDCYNTFNKTNYSTFKNKTNKLPKYNNYYRPNQYNSFFKSSAPFNYYNNMNEKDSLLVRYNGGPQKEYRPFITRENLAKFLRTRSSSIRYKRPCGCYSKYNLAKYSQVWEHPDYEQREQYNTFYKKKDNEQLPYIMDNDNMRYSNGFMSPQVTNRNGKISYKLKGNFDNNNNNNNDNYGLNTESNNYGVNKNMNDNVNEQENVNVNANENQIENKVVINEEKKEENVENNEKNETNSYTKNYNCFNLRPRRRFHKVQIFNNCKPFLVDDFKEYGYYE